MLLAWMSSPSAAWLIMNLPVLVYLTVFRRRLGSNPKGVSTAALVAGAAAWCKQAAALSREQAVGRVW